jgi:hypothetical protein
MLECLSCAGQCLQISSVVLLLVGNSRPHALLLHDKCAACLCRLTSTKSGTTSASLEHNALARPCQCSPTTASCLDHLSSKPRAHTAAMTLTQCTSSSRSPQGNTQSAIARACAMSAFLMGCSMYLHRSHPHVTRFTHNYSPDSKFFPPGGPGNAGSEGVCLPVNTGQLTISVAMPTLGTNHSCSAARFMCQVCTGAVHKHLVHMIEIADSAQ